MYLFLNKSMSKQDFISGSVFEFKLPFDIGFGYCKIIDFRAIRKFDGVIIKVFDCIPKKPLNDIDSLVNVDYLFGARRLADIPNTRGKGAWKMRGILVAADDRVIPEFKYSNKSFPLIKDESTISPWFVVRNINQISEVSYPYESIKHLEDTVITGQLGIEIRTAMEYMRENKMDITKYFDVSVTVNWNIYRTILNIPIYKNIPNEIRGKVG
jgi:hypothetical protein